MSNEEDRTFNDEQRAMFEQPDDAPVKTRPRTPGEPRANQAESNVNQSDAGDEAGGDSEETET